MSAATCDHERARSISRMSRSIASRNGSLLRQDVADRILGP